MAKTDSPPLQPKMSTREFGLQYPFRPCRYKHKLTAKSQGSKEYYRIQWPKTLYWPDVKYETTTILKP